MTILLNPFSRIEDWAQELAALLPNEQWVRWPEVGDPAEVEFMVAWVMPRSAMSQFTNLKAVLNLGAGTEQWQKDGMPNDVTIVRLSDPEMSSEMASYALYWVLHFQREFVRAGPNQATKVFEQPDYTQAYEFPVGILGYGTIGARIGELFASLGYPINAWSRSGGPDPGVNHYTGLDELDGFLANSRAVINVLPSTDATTGLLNKARLAKFAAGSILVNIGRGTVLDQTALLGAIDNGPLRAAVLDVTTPEPLPLESPLWEHPDVHLTSHVAGSTIVRSAAKLVADNIRRIRAGDVPFPVLDRSRGY